MNINGNSDIPEDKQRNVPEGIIGGASGGASKVNSDLPTSVRIDSGGEGGVLSLPKDKAPPAERLPKN